MNTTTKVYAARRKQSEAGISLRKVRTWYADEPPTQDKPTDATPPQGQTPPDKKVETEADAEKTWLPERLERAKKDAQAKLLKDLGYDDPKLAKAALDKLKTLEQEKLSESERATLALKEAQDARVLAETRAKELEHEIAVGKLNTLITALAEDAHNAQHVIRELASGDDYAAWVEKPNETQIKARIEALRKGKDTAYLFKQAGGRGSPLPPKGTSRDPLKALGDKRIAGI